jgi:DNA-binding NarL/FixJ family response regulator
MVADWPFVGRQEELVLIAQAMRDQHVGGLVLAGPAGVGKSRLGLEVLTHADPASYVTRRAVATQATQPLPFGALAPLLPAELPPASDRVNLLRLAAEALTAAAGQRRLVLAVDDAHLLDELSAALLHQLIREAVAFVLAILRSGEPAPEPVAALWRNRLVERVDLAELLRPDVEQVLVEYLGGPVDGVTKTRLWQASAGNTLLLRELVTAGHQAGVLQRVEGVWRWQGPWVLAPRLIELIHQRLGQLEPNERDVLESLALAEPIGPDLLSRLTSAEALEAVEAKGLCWAEPMGKRVLVHLVHPLYGEVLRAGMPVLRARRRQRQLAEVVEQTGARRADDRLRVATWRLASGSTVSPKVLLAAAMRAWALLDLDLTERLAREAFQAGAKLEASKVLWPLLMIQGRIEEALDLLAPLDDAATNDQERAKLAVARAYLYWGYDPLDAHLRVIDEALAELANPVARAELQALQAAMYAHACQFEPATQLADDLLHRANLPGSLLCYAHFTKAMTLLFHGQTAKAAAGFDQAIAAHGSAVETPWIDPVILLWRCQALLLHGELNAAVATTEAAYQRGLGSGSAMLTGMACLGRGQVCRARGQLQQSLRWLREGVAVMQKERAFLSQLLGELAHASAQFGDHAAAEAALTEADALRRHNFLVYHLWLDLARPWVTAAGGNRPAAVQQALQVATKLRAANAPVYEAVALHDAARLGAGGRVVERLGELAQDSESILIRTYATHALALTHHDGPELEQVSAELEAIGALLLAAEAAAEASHAYRAAGRADSTRRAAAKAATLAAQCEGAATPALLTLQTPDLTPRELEIARLAAAGLTNEDIADRLVVSVRTVHNHLHHVYSKLGVRRRTELAAVFEPSTTVSEPLARSPARPGQRPPRG